MTNVAIISVYPFANDGEATDHAVLGSFPEVFLFKCVRNWGMLGGFPSRSVDDEYLWNRMRGK